MAKYIDKEALVAEIKRLHKVHCGKYGCDEVALNLEYLEDFLDTLEVKEVGVDLGDPKGDKSAEYVIDTNIFKGKDVDLEKEYKDFVEIIPVHNKLVNDIIGKAIAKHFFELGLKAQKGE